MSLLRCTLETVWCNCTSLNQDTPATLGCELQRQSPRVSHCTFNVLPLALAMEEWILSQADTKPNKWFGQQLEVSTNQNKPRHPEAFQSPHQVNLGRRLPAAQKLLWQHEKSCFIAEAVLTLQSLCPLFYPSHPKEVTRTTPKKQAGKPQCSQAQLGHRENEKPGHNIASLPTLTCPLCWSDPQSPLCSQ